MRARRRTSGRRDGRFFERAIGLALVASLTAACAAATAPVAVPLLWGVIIAVATWPPYRRLRDALGGRAKLAAALVALLLALTLAAPVVALSLSLAGYAQALGPALERLGHAGPPAPPAWLAGVPAVGPPLDALWREATADLGALLGHLQPYLARATGWALARGADLGLALVQFLAAILVAAVLHATGEPALALLARLLRRVGGEREVALLALAGHTIRGVALGVVGTAVVQGAVAGLGLLVAGAPAPLLLGFAAFAVAIVQLPASVMLLPVAGWLFWDGATWQAVFLAAWALLVVGTVDNLVRPYLISQGADLPFVLVTVGVVGGLLAWGFLGMFLGATLLAVGHSLLRDWLDDDRRPPWRRRPPA
jgi:predicted PurR-regulated permease PerM